METDSILSVIGERIKARRKELGITQAQLSYTCETDPSYIRKVESGKVNISIKNLAEIAQALDSTLVEILDGF